MVSTQLSAQKIANALQMPPPTDEQSSVIEAPPNKPLLVVAGAGSGKTETMASRVVWLVANEHVAPEQILGLTFTRKAAGELAVRVRTRLQELREARLVADDLAPHERALATPTITTYNSYAARLVSEHALRLGVEPDAITLSEAGQWQLVHDIVTNWPDDLGVSAAPSTVIKAVIHLAGSCAEHLIEPGQVADFLHTVARNLDILAGEKKLPAPLIKMQRRWLERSEIIPLVERYVERKRDENLLDFSDQVSLIAALVREDPQIAQTEREKFRCVLLDEYQDTSHAQAVLLSGLFGAGHPVTAVGDPLQAIYGWRGASAGALLRFPDVFPQMDAKTGEKQPAAHRNLTIAWRNDAAILEAANRTAAPLLAAQDSANEAHVKSLRPRESAGAGEIEAAYLETTELEARKIAEFLRDRRGTNASPTSEPVSAAVLCRTRSQFDEIMSALLAADIPVEVVGLGGLLGTPEITDIVSTLRACHDPLSGNALIRLLTNPRWNFGIRDLHALSAWSRKISGEARDDRSIIDALDDLSTRKKWPTDSFEISPLGQRRLAELGNMLRELRAKTGQRLVTLIGEVERALLFDIEFAIDPVRSAQAIHHLEQFRQVAARYETTGNSGAPVTLGGFLEWLDAAQEQERGLAVTSVDPNPSAVQLLTIHAAKGLEWDVVVVAGLVEGTFPSYNVRKDPAKPAQDSGWLSDWGELPYDLRGDRDELPEFHAEAAGDPKHYAELVEDFRIDCGEHVIEEERRLAYVAFTRARKSLLLTGSWWKPERQNPVRPSRFFTELIRSELVGGAVPSDPVNVTNPLLEIEETATWPLDVIPRDEQEQLRALALRVRKWQESSEESQSLLRTSRDGEVAMWMRHADLLLAEQQAQATPESAVDLPAHLPASALVSLVEDPRKFALLRRRPIPTEPTGRSRLGTAFHSWIEQHYGAPTLVDLDDLPGADTVNDDADLAALQQVFSNSHWAHRQPLKLEVDIDTPVGDTIIRCRIDAVFQQEGGKVLIVDWKTGRPPEIGSETHHQRSVQLAVYRLAWARLYEVPLEDIEAVFVHVAPSGITEVHALELSDAEILETLRSQAPGGKLEFA